MESIRQRLQQHSRNLSRRRKLPNRLGIGLNRVPWVSSEKYLKLRMDYRLIWLTHFRYVGAKAHSNFTIRSPLSVRSLNAYIRRSASFQVTSLIAGLLLLRQVTLRPNVGTPFSQCYTLVHGQLQTT